MKLTDTYWKKQPQPKGSNIFVELQPRVVTLIDSVYRRVGLEMYVTMVWEDSRVVWQGLELGCWDTMAFDTAILT